MENFVKELISEKEQTLGVVVGYIVNTIKSKSLYKKGGWKEVRKEFTDMECFNHNFSISATAICMKLRENNEPINLPIESNMELIEVKVNDLLGVKSVQYYVDRKNHALEIVL